MQTSPQFLGEGWLKKLRQGETKRQGGKLRGGTTEDVFFFSSSGFQFRERTGTSGHYSSY